jgi:alpha-glucosidase
MTGNTNNWVWWKHGAIYQIYTRSFFDSNGDGIGDLSGVTQKLDYLKQLGISAIWLTPVFETPNFDFGYDVRDYQEIDPTLGTMEDFKEMIHEAKKRNIRVILDMVLNHTSHLHSWFLESKSSPENPKRDWYIWKDKVDGGPPNNWKNAFGGSAWEWDAKTEQYYFHSFLKEQPDLNWRNPEILAIFSNIMKFWLNLGVDGFRLDVINMIIKDKKFRDNPTRLKLPFFQEQKYNFNQNKSLKIVKHLRNIMDEYPEKLLVGEIYTLPPGNTNAAVSYLGNGNDSLHLAFDFSLLFSKWNARGYYLNLKKWHKLIPREGWPCHVLSNHDLHRSFNRNGLFLEQEKKAKVAAVLMLTLRGTPFIYYGEEIGMENTPVPRNKISDPLGLKFWPLYSGRDQARRPMLWNNTVHAGFSTQKPWLPVNNRYQEKCVEYQAKDEMSIYSLYRKLLHIRSTRAALTEGRMEFLEKGQSGVLSYLRQHNEENILVVLNFSSRKKTIALPRNTHWKVLLNTYISFNDRTQHNFLVLLGYEAVVLQQL